MIWLKANIETESGSSLGRVDDRVLVEDVMKHVRWDFASFEQILALYQAFPKLRHNIHTKAIFHNQLKYRATKSKVLV
jgi:hypothetical protein